MYRMKLIVAAIVIAVAALLAFTPPGKRVLSSLGLAAACDSSNGCENRPK